MFDEQQITEYYQALINRDSSYEGVFFAGITSTGIFCRPTCTARKPKRENCLFFKTAQASLLAGFRPCKRCRPLLNPSEPSDMVKHLTEMVESEPTRRWTDKDVRELGYTPSTVRRQFKKRYGMTFTAYSRARRMGIALKTIREGDKIINAQIDAGYSSGSGFRDAFSSIMGSAPNDKNHKVLKAEWIDTPLGSMVAIFDETHLYLLEFTDRRGLEREIEKMRKSLKVAIVPGRSPVTQMIEDDLAAYFKGELQEFTTPFKVNGSDFQKSVWDELLTIPYGVTRSYAEQAQRIGNPKAVRAVARANGMNQLAIIIPCHRVIGSDGKLTGYAGGLARKEWLLDLEKANQ
jgi:AraC family transcriptional regulator of adaptative response/methylated-DNA-[protein]-cysteine methyltransferase